MLKELQLLEALELVYSSTDKFPGWTFTQVIGRLVENCNNSKARYLVVSHYAGNACITGHDNNPAFFASDQEPRKKAMACTFGALCDKAGEPKLKPER